MRRGTWLAAVAVLATSCSPDVPPPLPPGQSSGQAETPESVTPSITRDVPPEQRRPLDQLTSEQLCELVSPDELRQLAFPVEAGRPRDLGADLPAKGCTFPTTSGVRSILIASQPPGYGLLGRDEVQLGPVRGTKTLRANDCTTFADVQGGSLQVTVTVAEADADQCEMAQSVAQYVLPALSR